MKNYCDRLGFLTTLTVMLMAAPAIAAEQQITDIELDNSNNQLELKLATSNKNANASFFTVRKGNTIEANLLNTNLNLPQKNSFNQTNPIPGIKAVAINQVDQEHTQILIDTEPGVPIEHLLTSQGNNLILSLNRVTKAQSFQREIKQLGQEAITNIKQTYKSALGDNKTKDNEKLTEVASKNNSEDSEVLIPNPEVVISNNGPNGTQEQIFTAQDDSTSQTTLPRAVAPPVGDMAVSNISTMPDMVDLGSTATVDNLLLQDAPIREVLSLLARTANLNIVFAAGKPQEGQEETKEPTISLDLKNQPVQEVFNSVLLVSGLNANRRGNIIYVGEQLPPQARNLVSRTVRLNQVKAENAALYLASQGAKGKRLTSEVEEIIDPETNKVAVRKETSPKLEDLDSDSEDTTGTQALMLDGLQVATDGRLNAITLVGEPRKVEMATAMLTQLDARRRQVAVNVKVIDVNLLNQDLFNSSFSFGVNDSFFVNDKGSAALNFGGVNPPETKTVTTRGGFPRVLGLPIPDGATVDYGFIDDVQRKAPASDSVVSTVPFSLGFPNFYGRGPFGTNHNPFQPGVTDVDAQGKITFELPSLYEVPDKFLALLEAKVTSGNAKILTDPTLMVQEGQQATVKLVQKIVESVKTEIDKESGARTITPQIGEAGVSLTVDVDRIDDNGFISLSVSPRVTSVGATQNFDSGGGAENLLNLLSVRELNSGAVQLRDGQTLILSGIIQDRERNTISKIPILGDIPLLGSLFRSNDKTNERAEVIVLLTPEIVEEDAGLASNFSPSKESREVLEKQGVDVLQKSEN